MPALLPALLLALSGVSCPERATLVLVSTAEHRLLLCESGKVARSFPIAIGSGGAAPGRVGWAQTPLGRFALQSPRASARYHLFIPLENPDPKRFSAWAIGIHGPPRENRDDGASNVATDWTLGCLAVAADADIEAIAGWVREHARPGIDVR